MVQGIPWKMVLQPSCASGYCEFVRVDIPEDKGEIPHPTNEFVSNTPQVLQAEGNHAPVRTSMIFGDRP